MKSPLSRLFALRLQSGGQSNGEGPSVSNGIKLFVIGAVLFGVIAYFAVGDLLCELWRELRVGFLYQRVAAEVEQVTQPVLGLDSDEDEAGEIRYRYLVGRRWYQGFQRLYPRSDKDKAFLASHSQLGKGGELSIYYDPGNPGRSRLDAEPQLGPVSFFLMFLSAFLAVGVALMIAGVRGMRDAVWPSKDGPRQGVGLLGGMVYLGTYVALAVLGTLLAVIATSVMSWRVELGVTCLWLVVAPILTFWLGRRARAAIERLRATPPASTADSETIVREFGGKLRWVAAAFFAVFLVAGVYLGITEFVQPYLRARQALHWPPVPCAILRSDVKTRQSDEGTTYRLRVQYSYRVDGREYTSTRYQFGQEPSGDYNRLRVLADSLPPGKPSVCCVDPRNPAEAVLNRHLAPAFVLPAIFSSVFVVFGATGATLALATSLRRRLVAMLAARVAVLVLGVFLVLGGVGTAFMYVLPLCEAFRWRAWDKTPCVIVSSRMVSHEDDEHGTTYGTEIIYAYHVRGREYRSDRFGPANIASNVTGAKSAILKQYRPGTKTVCYVNPSNPAQAVLVRSLAVESVLGIGLMPLGMAVACLAGLVLLLLRGRVRERVAPFAKFAVAVGAWLLFNGIIAAPFWEVVRSFQLGRPAWFLGVFLVPFVLVSLVFSLVLLAIAATFLYRSLLRRSAQCTGPADCPARCSASKRGSGVD